MAERKSLADISWLVDETTYRNDKALSYSTLSKFHRLGPRALISDEKIDTVSLRFGSTVDTILTCPEEFDDRFYVADIDKFGDKMRLIVEMLNQICPDAETIEDCIDQYMIETLNTVGYQAGWKDDTRIKKVKELGAEYYTVLKYSTGKIVISPQEFSEAQQCVNTLRTHQYTYDIFECNEDEEVLYQLKFKTQIQGVPFRFMMDLVKIDHENKTVKPFDLKTTGDNEESFESSYVKWCYFLQSEGYWTALNWILREDDYFKDFELLPFEFIVINKNNLTPLRWIDKHIEDNTNELFNKYGITFQSLLQDANWHLQNGKFDYSRKSYENNGINPIILKL